MPQARAPARRSFEGARGDRRTRARRLARRGRARRPLPLPCGAIAQRRTLLTAHTQDDQLETVLLQLFRGCGLPGLAAMPAVAPLGAGRLARPLLACPRAQLEAWLRARELAWVEDDTNRDERFDRNYLRRQVLPAVRQRWPGVGAAVARSARHAAEAQGLLATLARVDIERASDGAALSVKALRSLPPDRRRNVLRLWIASGGRTLPDARRLEEIAGPLIDARADAHPQVEWDRRGPRSRRMAGASSSCATRNCCRSRRGAMLDSGGAGGATRMGLAAILALPAAGRRRSGADGRAPRTH